MDEKHELYISGFFWGSPRMLAERSVSQLREHLGREPSGDEMRAVATYFRSAATELVALIPPAAPVVATVDGRGLCSCGAGSCPYAPRGAS